MLVVDPLGLGVLGRALLAGQLPPMLDHPRVTLGHPPGQPLLEEGALARVGAARPAALGQLLPALLLGRPRRIRPGDPGRGGIDPDRAAPQLAPVVGVQLLLDHQHVPTGEIRAGTVFATASMWRPGSQVAVAVPVADHLHPAVGVQRCPRLVHRGPHPARMGQAELVALVVGLEHHPSPLRWAIQDLDERHPTMVLRPARSSRAVTVLRYIPALDTQRNHTEQPISAPSAPAGGAFLWRCGCMSKKGRRGVLK